MQNVDLSQRDRFEEERKNLFDEAPERRREQGAVRCEQKKLIAHQQGIC